MYTYAGALNGIGVRFLSNEEFSLFSIPPREPLWRLQLPILRAHSSGVKRPEPESNMSSPLMTIGKKNWRCTFVSQYTILWRGVCLNKQMNTRS